jgi:hypothetical protein
LHDAAVSAFPGGIAVSIVSVPSQPRGWKSMPTEFRTYRPGDGAERIARTGEGLTTADAAQQLRYVDGSRAEAAMGLRGNETSELARQLRYVEGNRREAAQALRGLGSWATDIAALTQATGQVTLSILAAQNPGVRVTTSPDGTVQVYNTAGQVELLPGNYGFDAATQTIYQKQPGGSITTTRDTTTASFSLGDLDSTTIMMIAVIGLLGIMAIKK